MQTNTHGPLRIVNLIAKKARKPVSFVHMSTAYVGSCEPSGTRVMETLSHVNIPPPPSLLFSLPVSLLYTHSLTPSGEHRPRGAHRADQDHDEGGDRGGDPRVPPPPSY